MRWSLPSQVLREAFRRPRDTLLNIVADFLSRCSTRLVELSRKPAAGGEAKQVELLDVKCHSVGPCAAHCSVGLGMSRCGFSFL